MQGGDQRRMLTSLRAAPFCWPEYEISSTRNAFSLLIHRH
jgi:hypothetical protein